MAGEPFLPWHAQFAVCRTRRVDDGLGLVNVSPTNSDPLSRTFQVQLRDVVVNKFGAELFRLLLHLHHQIRPHDPVGEPRVVFHFGGVHQFPTNGHRTGNNNRAQVGAGSVDGCRVSGRT